MSSSGLKVNSSQLGLEYLSRLTPWNGRGGFSLSELARVMGRLGDPQDKLPCVHIAGTNGKGSVSAASAAILGACGYRVGLNISPHLQRVNERIVIDGFQVSDEFLGDFAYSVRQAAHREGVELSFHEATTALAFIGLYESGVEWLVIEVGLGGRLDASNVISRPAATAIVSISFDHQAILGDTLAKIAAEKAGIVKPGVPLVTGYLPVEADTVISAKAQAGPHFKFGRDFNVIPKVDGAIGFWGKDFVGERDIRFDFSPPLAGAHQAHNLGVAAAIGLVLGLPQERVKAGVEGVFWPARLEVLELSGLNLLLDCAHNIAGVASFISFLESSGFKEIDLIFGVLDTKDWREMVAMLKPYVKVWRLLAPQSERALPLEALVAEIGISGNGVRIECYGERYEVCLEEIVSERRGDMGFVTGSMYMVGRIRELIGVQERPIWRRDAIVL